MRSRGSKEADSGSIISQVKDFIEQKNLLIKGDRVLVGVSGGPDSMALLDILVTLSHDYVLKIHIVHVDHKIRPESGKDSEFVLKVAKGLGVGIDVVEKDAIARSKKDRLSLEDAARRVRYEAFLDVAHRRSFYKIALGHNADDQAETVLMRMMRGAGMTGLAAIPVKRQIKDVFLIRPLLGTWRPQIIEYLKSCGISYLIDSTNSSQEFVRNRIRTALLPSLEKDYNPQIKILLAQLAHQCQEDYLFLDETASRYWKRLSKLRNGSVSMNLRGLLSKPKALQRQLVRIAIKKIQGDLNGFEFRHWLEIEQILKVRPVGSIVDLPGGICIERMKDHILVRYQSKHLCKDDSVELAC